MPKSGPNGWPGVVHLSCSYLSLLAVSLMMVSSAGTLSGAGQPRFG